MKPEKVDYYLNKRKERDAERQKPEETGETEESGAAEQSPNRWDAGFWWVAWPLIGQFEDHQRPALLNSCLRSPASEEKTRVRGRRSRDSSEAGHRYAFWNSIFNMFIYRVIRVKLANCNKLFQIENMYRFLIKWYFDYCKGGEFYILYQKNSEKNPAGH